MRLQGDLPKIKESATHVIFMDQCAALSYFAKIAKESQYQACLDLIIRTIKIIMRFILSRGCLW